MAHTTHNLLRTLLTLLLLAVSFAAMAQQRPARDVPAGFNPAEDSLVVSAIRHRMDSIRAHRPTVGLVLSGGGAKGACHVGVIRYMKEVGLPVDLVVGTSIGGLVGGVMALGYGPDEIEDLFSRMDWNEALTDRLPRKYMSYTQRKYKETYLASLPFYYSSEALELDESGHKKGELQRPGQPMFGVEGAKASASSILSNIKGSLPSGFIYGQNVNNLITSLTVGYQDSLRFDALPIPFVCVSTEMVSARAKVWYAGRLVTAMRSTMSIPGLFAPVKTDGMVLVDGGLRNNFPTDLARSLGADLVIGVDLSEGFYDYDQINNLLDIISQGIDMFGRPSYEENIRMTEVTVKPDVSGYNMMSFDPASIDTLLRRGYRAALQQSHNLAAAKELVGPDTLTYQAPKAIDITEQRVMIKSIVIDGVSDKDSRYLMGLLRLKVPSIVADEELRDAVAKVFATGTFDQVSYSLEGKEEPFDLHIRCSRGPVHQLGFGTRFDTEEVVSLLVNVGIGTRNISGWSVDITGKISVNPMIRVQGILRNAAKQTVNAAVQYKFVDRNQFSVGESRFKAAYHNLREELFLSNINWKDFDIKVGVRNDFYRLSSAMTDKVAGDYDLGNLQNSYVSTFLTGHMDNLDDGYFPTRGVRLGADYQWVIGALQDGFHNPFHVIKADATGVVANIRERFAIIPSGSVRLVLGEEIPLPYVNVFGGVVPGRYLDQQIPFVGINNAATADNMLVVAGLEGRLKLTDNNYVSVLSNVGLGFDSIGSLRTTTSNDFLLGFGLRYSYHSVAGPLIFQAHWSNVTNSVGAYLGFGYFF